MRLCHLLDSSTGPATKFFFFRSKKTGTHGAVCVVSLSSADASAADLSITQTICMDFHLISDRVQINRFTHGETFTIIRLFYVFSVPSKNDVVLTSAQARALFCSATFATALCSLLLSALCISANPKTRSLRSEKTSTSKRQTYGRRRMTT